MMTLLQDMTYLVLFSTFVWAQDGHRFKGYPTYLRNSMETQVANPTPLYPEATTTLRR